MARKRTRIQLEGMQDVMASFKKLQMSAKNSRTAINKALRPAGDKLARGMQKAYRAEFNRFEGTRKSGRTPTWKTIGIVTARRAKTPRLYVGPIKRRTTPITVKGKDSYNLAAMQIKGNAIQAPRKDIFEATGKKMHTSVSLKAEKDIDKMINKMLRNAGF